MRKLVAFAICLSMFCVSVAFAAEQKVGQKAEQKENVTVVGPGALDEDLDGMTRGMQEHIAGPQWAPGTAEMVIIASKTCPHCQYMETMMKQLCEDLSCDASISKVDIEVYGDKLEKYGVDEGVPVLIFFDKNGKRVHRILGATDPISVAKGFLDHGVDVMKEVEPFIENWRKMAEEEKKKRLESIPKDNTSLKGIGEWFDTKAGDDTPELTLFLSHSCPHCTRMDEMIQLLSKNTDMKLRVRKIYMDGTKAVNNLASTFVVEAVPTLLLFGSDGKFLERVVGSLPAEMLIEKFKGFGYDTFVGYDEYLKGLQEKAKETAEKKEKLEAAIESGMEAQDKVNAEIAGNVEKAPDEVVKDEVKNKAAASYLGLDEMPLLSELGEPDTLMGKLGGRKILAIFVTGSHADGIVADIFTKKCNEVQEQKAKEDKASDCDMEIRIYKANPERMKVFKKWDIQYFPMLAFANGKGEIRDFVVGFITPDMASKLFEEMMQAEVE